MNQTTTGIVVALAVAVVAVFFLFPGLSPFGTLQPQSATATTTTTQDATAPVINSDQTATTPMPTNATQLQVTDETVGTGATAEPGDSVTVNYVGSLTNGTVFDASANHGSSGFTFTLGAGQVIQGWDQGIVGMKVGGKRELVIPPALGYGGNAVGNIIPPNSTLVFQVELLSVTPPAAH
jgi:FKBP-type peptidyl-prolyl cis-trans isomerase